MPDDIIIRNAITPEDGSALKALYNEVFHPQPVGELAQVLFHHLPGMTPRNWFMAEDRAASGLCGAIALIPWTWEMDGVPLKVAEQGLVGTRQAYRNRGLMRRLNDAFDRVLQSEGYDLAVIQGIPGFYHNFGYHYAVDLENHVELPLHGIPDLPANSPWKFREATLSDIPFLRDADQKYRAANVISVYRNEAAWQYLLTHSRNTEYGSEFWIADNGNPQERIYFRRPMQGFGNGLIISEISADATHDGLLALFSFCKAKALAQGKPHIRINLHNQSPAAQAAVGLGARPGSPYGWQVKIPAPAALLEKMAPVLEKRLQQSVHRGFGQTLRLDFYTHRIDLVWNRGKLVRIDPDGNGPCHHTFFMTKDLFSVLCLGRRSWRELNFLRPDIAPANFHTRGGTAGDMETCASVVDALFPKTVSWVHEQY